MAPIATAADTWRGENDAESLLRSIGRFFEARLGAEHPSGDARGQSTSRSTPDDVAAGPSWVGRYERHVSFKKPLLPCATSPRRAPVDKGPLAPLVPAPNPGIRARGPSPLIPEFGGREARARRRGSKKAGRETAASAEPPRPGVRPEVGRVAPGLVLAALVGARELDEDPDVALQVALGAVEVEGADRQVVEVLAEAAGRRPR